MDRLRKVDKIGDGTYSDVYRAHYIGEESKVVALKRNLTDQTTSFHGNIREANMLARVKNHPFVIDLVCVSFGDPFTRTDPMTPRPNSKHHMKEDRLHFIMDLIETTGEKFFVDKNKCTPDLAKLLMTQLLLGVEFIHAKGVAHRDLKPANLLINSDPSDPRLRICDFGMSQIGCRSIPATPGVATSWYRAPEVCCEVPTAGRNADMWAVGCILFELVGPRPLLYGTEDTTEGAFNAALSRLPRAPSPEAIEALFQAGRRLPIHGSPIRRSSWLELLALTPEYVQTFNSTPGSLSEFIDVLEALFVLIDRPSATAILEMPFFHQYREYIAEVRRLYPPIPDPLPPIEILPCIERKWMVNVVFTAYNTEPTRILPRVLFHTIELFDRYLSWAFRNCTLRESENSTLGRLHSRYEVELRTYVIMYMFHKFFTTMAFPLEWRKFTPIPAFHTPEAELEAEQFEGLILRTVTVYHLYHETPLEIADHYNHHLDPAEIRDLLLLYGTGVSEWSGQSIRALYRHLRDLKDRRR